MRERTTVSRITPLVVAVTVLVPALPGGTDVRHVPLAVFSVGDLRSELASASDVFLTSYRFDSGSHSYALASSLRGRVGRRLVFIDDRLACVPMEWHYDPTNDGSRFRDHFWSDHAASAGPIGEWEWANESAGLEYLAATLREACGLERIGDRRQLQRRWGSRTMSAGEIAEAAAEIVAQLPLMAAYGILTQGYGGAWPPGSDPAARRDFELRDRLAVEQRLWSVTLGQRVEELPAALGAPDVQYTWRRTGTTVIAYQLGSPNPYFVGVADGRAAWIREQYPGLVLQAKLAALELSESREKSAEEREAPGRD